MSDKTEHSDNILFEIAPTNAIKDLVPNVIKKYYLYPLLTNNDCL